MAHLRRAYPWLLVGPGHCLSRSSRPGNARCFKPKLVNLFLASCRGPIPPSSRLALSKVYFYPRTFLATRANVAVSDANAGIRMLRTAVRLTAPNFLLHWLLPTFSSGAEVVPPPLASSSRWRAAAAEGCRYLRSGVK